MWLLKMRVRICLSFLVICLLICKGICGEVKSGALEDNTDSIFGNKKGIIAAYGDFDADQNTDVFVISPATTSSGAPELSVLIWHSGEGEPHLKQLPHLVLKRFVGEVITSLVPGDYDGDSKMDVLVTIKSLSSLNDEASTAVYIYWGNLSKFDSNVPSVVSMNMTDQPLVMDYDANMIPDIFGVNDDGKRALWIQSSSSPRNFSMRLLDGLENGNAIRIPHSNAFLDLNADFATDIFITSVTPAEENKFEVWGSSLKSYGGYIRTNMYSLPEDNLSVIGQSAFTDIDADGTIDHILPVCFDKECRRSAIYKRKNGKWTKMINFEKLPIHGEILGFVPGPGISLYADIPITLSIGDFNTDRYPDIMVVMRTKNNTRQVVLIQNEEGVQFQPVVKMGALGAIENPIIATFVDISDNIMLDMFVVSQQNPTSTPQLHAVKNKFVVDAYFIRVQVLSGLCFTGCLGFASGTYAYGVNQPGPMVHYVTTGTSGKKERSTGAQLSQSAYYSLQIPSVFMGLGQNPNFVDTVTAAIPTNNSQIRFKDWTSIIPNSILIVIPEPPTNPSAWDVKLLITPGQSVFLTAGALLGTCLFVAMIVGLLHLKERRQDEKEKRQESHRFHFDAM